MICVGIGVSEGFGGHLSAEFGTPSAKLTPLTERRKTAGARSSPKLAVDTMIRSRDLQFSFFSASCALISTFKKVEISYLKNRKILALVFSLAYRALHCLVPHLFSHSPQISYLICGYFPVDTLAARVCRRPFVVSTRALVHTRFLFVFHRSASHLWWM